LTEAQEDKTIRNEKNTVKAMIALYCRHHHNTVSDLCPACHTLLQYSNSKLDRCPFIEKKPACSQCTVHCYIPDMREKIRAAMRYSGPRMLYNHPALAVKHMVKKIRS
jgi:hypothetical protein